MCHLYWKCLVSAVHFQHIQKSGNGLLQKKEQFWFRCCFFHSSSSSVHPSDRISLVAGTVFWKENNFPLQFSTGRRYSVPYASINAERAVPSGQAMISPTRSAGKSPAELFWLITTTMSPRPDHNDCQTYPRVCESLVYITVRDFKKLGTNRFALSRRVDWYHYFWGQPLIRVPFWQFSVFTRGGFLRRFHFTQPPLYTWKASRIW